MASEIKVDTVSEKTSANGVTIDGLNIKDAKLATANSVVETNMSADSVDSDSYVDGSIDTAHIADGQVTIGKLATAVLTGATDIGEAIVDADLLLVDNGAGGTLRKTAASRLKTYIGGAQGITVADQWFLTANTAMAAGANDITSNLARAVSSPFGSIGSAMTESSGIFTFPSTGIYEVRASFQGDASDANDSYQGLIQSTTDNSSYGVRAIAYNYLDQITMTISAIFDITNVSNDKVKFSTQNVASGQTATLLGNSGMAQTCFLFLRLGDT